MTKPVSKKLSPEKYAEGGSETAEQIALFMWAQQNLAEFPELKWLFAIPNGGFRTKSEASRFRAMGVKAGVPDMFFPVVCGDYHGLFIELKPRPKGKRKAREPEDHQIVWLKGLQDNGYGTIVCYGFEDARDTLLRYLNWGP